MRTGVISFGLASLLFAAAAQAQAPKRLGPDASPISSSVSVPEGSRLVYVSGTVPDAVKPDLQTCVMDGSATATTGCPHPVERYGDTETQTRSILGKIDAELKKHGLSMGDVVMMRVFLVAPPGQQRMDFAGMMKAYRERFGTAAQLNKPARSTMQVAGLVDPGWLVEIEVTAAAPGQKAAR
jgi:enamine deaminase RidA (YjgF/YER057c/UK114 family)